MSTIHQHYPDLRTFLITSQRITQAIQALLLLTGTFSSCHVSRYILTLVHQNERPM